MSVAPLVLISHLLKPKLMVVRTRVAFDNLDQVGAFGVGQRVFF